MKTRPHPSEPVRPAPFFWYQVLTLLTLIVMVAAVGGLGLVWVRQQITDTAARIHRVQRDTVEVRQRTEYLDARIAAVHRPDVLRKRAEAMGLVLTRPMGRQIVRMGPLSLPLPAEAPETQIAPRSGAGNRPGFELAVMEPVNGQRN